MAMIAQSTTATLTGTELGPAMKLLTEKQRNFVYAMIEQGGMNYSQAAATAGYAGGDKEKARNTGWALAHDRKIQDAIREVGLRLMNAGSVHAVKYVLETVMNPQVDPKNRLKAAELIMNRTGLHPTTEHKVAVTHKTETSDEMVKQIERMAKTLGVDPQKLLGRCVVDAEFTEVKRIEVPAEDDLSDIY